MGYTIIISDILSEECFEAMRTKICDMLLPHLNIGLVLALYEEIKRLEFNPEDALILYDGIYTKIRSAGFCKTSYHRLRFLAQLENTNLLLANMLADLHIACRITTQFSTRMEN